MSQLTNKEYFHELSGEGWLSAQEGQLSVDVMETPDSIIVRSAIAGMKAKDLDIALNEDTLTIRGARHHGHDERLDQTTHVQECFWGTFSRSIVLPVAVKPNKTDAVLKNGILTITMKKAEISSHIDVIDISD